MIGVVRVVALTLATIFSAGATAYPSTAAPASIDTVLRRSPHHAVLRDLEQDLTLRRLPECQSCQQTQQ